MQRKKNAIKVFFAITVVIAALNTTTLNVQAKTCQTKKHTQTTAHTNYDFGVADCTQTGKHSHNDCSVTGCTQTGEHSHNDCSVTGCTQTGEHSHNNCSVTNCTQTGEHTHYQSKNANKLHHNSQHKSRHH